MPKSREGRCADASLDDLVGKGEDRRRHYKAQLLRGLQVDEQDGLSGERSIIGWVSPQRAGTLNSRMLALTNGEI